MDKKTIKRVIVREGLVILGVIALILIAGFMDFNSLLLVPGCGYPLYLIFRFFIWAIRTLREDNKPTLRRVAVVATVIFIAFSLNLLFTFPSVFSSRTGFIGIGFPYIVTIFAISCMSGIVLIQALRKLKGK